MKMLTLMLFAAAPMIALSGPAAAATKYKCACLESAKATVESQTEASFHCAESYAGYDKSVSVQEQHLKVYVNEKNLVQSGPESKLEFRPRDHRCLEYVYDTGVDPQKKVFNGPSYCNTKDEKNVGPFTMLQRTSWEQSQGAWTAYYSATVGNPSQKNDAGIYPTADFPGRSIWHRGSDGKYSWWAVCIKD
jgi:hypothetical protein